MRPLSRETLARNEAAKLAASQMPSSPCAGHGRWWAALEVAHRRSRTPGQAVEVIEEARSRFCSGCPALLSCASWAQVQRYTGLAAGAAYENGERKEATWTVHVPTGQEQAS